MKELRVCNPTMDWRTVYHLIRSYRTGWWGNGPDVKKFETEFAKKVGKKYAVACNSGTSALDMCLKYYSDEYHIRGGELITTPMTFVSDAIVGLWHDMDITFADIEEDSLCLDPEKVVLSPKTKAIIVVNSHGRLANIKRLKQRIADAGLKILVIEDCAHSMFTPGTGEYSDIQMYSFQAVKTMPIGDGGMVTTDDEAVDKEMRKIHWLNVEKSTYDRSKGKKYTWDYDITKKDGIKAYMTNPQGVIGWNQLRRLDKMQAKRQHIQAEYNDALKDIPQIKTPMFSHTVQYYTIQCENRDALSDFLASQKPQIQTSVHFKPLSEMTAYKEYVKRPLPVTDRVWKKLLSLPCHDALTNRQQKFIIEKVREFYHA